MSQSDAPPIAALFLVVFDQKVGYKIAWKQTRPGTDLEGVEYQCLPSGLHSVREDLVYFIHGKFAGVSAFVQEEAGQEHRNASFVAVGALVPLSYGRLGKSWMHAEALRALAKATVKSLDDKEALEDFWNRHSRTDGRNGSASPSTQRPGENKRKRALSDATGAFAVERSMPRDHPALSMTALITSFGPLLFPLYRQALLRKRILLLCTTPVQRTCNFVYDLSILSNVPQRLQESISTENDRVRIQPLFNVGVFDITRLETHEDGWMACTTDDILGEKKKLYDVLVELPAASVAPGHKFWPKLRSTDGNIIKATQRDLRRYRSLRKELRRIERGAMAGRRYHGAESDEEDNEDETAPLVRPLNQLLSEDTDALQTSEAEVVQPESWGVMAYKSFMWWASAGEMSAWEADEALIDETLLGDLPELDSVLDSDRRSNAEDSDDNDVDPSEEAQKVATILVAYFHRVTNAILQTLASNVESADDETEEGYTTDAIEVSNDDLRRMGLDPWDVRDRDFVQDAMKVYFKRDAAIEDDSVRMCGMRVC